MNINLNKESSTPLYKQIRNNIKTMIVFGELSNGSKMPSVRKMAEALGVHKNTITKAYDELKADNLIVAKDKSGYYVNFQDASNIDNTVKHPISWNNVVNEDYKVLHTFNVFDRVFLTNVRYSFSGFNENNDVSDSIVLNKILLDIAKDKNYDKYLMADKFGDVKLRKAVASFLRRRGMAAKENEIKIVNTAFQAIEFIVKLLMEPGDVVLTAELVAPDVSRIFTSLGIKIVTVPMDDKGLCSEQLGVLIKKHKVRMLYVDPEFHNPTGVEMPLQRRKELVELAHKYELIVLEEALTSDIRFIQERVPPLKTLDRYNNVIYIYDCWYSLPSGLQMAFVYADKVLIENLSLIMVLRLIRESCMTQRIAAEYIANGYFEQKLEALSIEYKSKMDIVCQTIDSMDPNGKYVSYVKPNGGPNLFIKLLGNVNKRTLFNDAKTEEISFIIGDAFFPDSANDNTNIRLNLSSINLEDVREGTERLMKIIIANIS